MFHDLSVSLSVVGDRNRTLQSSANRQKISFHWNSRSLSCGSVVVANRSREQQLSELADHSKLVPYEVNMSDESETEKDGADAAEIVGSNAACTSNGIKHPHDGLSADVSVRTSASDSVTNAVLETEKLQKPVEPIATSSGGLTNSVDTVSFSGIHDRETRTLSASVSDLLAVPEVKSAEDKKTVVPVLSGKAQDSFAAGDVVDARTEVASGHSDVHHLSDNHIAAVAAASTHSAVNRKRHARHSLKRHSTKHRRRHRRASLSLDSTYYSSDDEEVEYVWVEKTAEKMVAQHNGNCHLRVTVYVTDVDSGYI